MTILETFFGALYSATVVCLPLETKSKVQDSLFPIVRSRVWGMNHQIYGTPEYKKLFLQIRLYTGFSDTRSTRATLLITIILPLMGSAP
jgi:hypothetical protein